MQLLPVVTWHRGIQNLWLPAIAHHRFSGKLQDLLASTEKLSEASVAHLVKHLVDYLGKIGHEVILAIA